MTLFTTGKVDVVWVRRWKHDWRKMFWVYNCEYFDTFWFCSLGIRIRGKRAPEGKLFS